MFNGKIKKYFYIKYYSFHDVIAVVKFTIFRLKTININIFFKKIIF